MQALAFSAYAASLGLLPPGRDVLDEARAGVLLLKLVERLRPGLVDWSRVARQPRNVFERVANCGVVLELAPRLGIRAVGIGPSDLAQASHVVL